MRTGAIFGTLLIVAVVLGGFLTSNSRPAHAVTYEAQCTTDGGKLKWDGVGPTVVLHQSAAMA
jgi:hypothetical protein